MPKGRWRMAASSFRNRESVIRAILRRERDGLPLNCEAIKGVSRPLCSGACRHFGSWRNALRAAGINAATIERRREWDKAKIIAHLRELCRQRRSLRQTVVHRYDSGLHRAACLTFGTWCNALVAAGINPELICRDPQWDRTQDYRGNLVARRARRGIGQHHRSSAYPQIGSGQGIRFLAGGASRRGPGTRPLRRTKGVCPERREKGRLEQGASPKSHSPTPRIGIAALRQLHPARRSQTVLCRADVVRELVQGLGVCWV